MNKKDKQKFASMIKEADKIVVLTGAGMSTQSGLKDFRGVGGMWRNKSIYDIANPNAIYSDTESFLNFYRWRIEEVLAHEPNEGHHILAKWANYGKVSHIITQNVDGYHEYSRIHDPSIKESYVIPVHGDILNLHCHSCKSPYLGTINEYLDRSQVTRCDCGGLYRPGVILFGENLDAQLITRAYKVAGEADLIIVLGSSLKVGPANGIPLECPSEKIIIVNHDKTFLDNIASLVIRDNIVDVLKSVDLELSEYFNNGVMCK